MTLSELVGKRLYFDSNLFIYFLEKDETFFVSVLPFFKLLADGQARGIASDLVLAELLVKPLRDSDPNSVDKIKGLLLNPNYFEMIGHDRKIFEYASLIRATEYLKMPDAIHVATAILSDCDYFVTQDAHIINNITDIKVIGL